MSNKTETAELPTSTAETANASQKKLWQIEIWPKPEIPNRLALEVAATARDLGLAQQMQVEAFRGFLVEGDLSKAAIKTIVDQLLVDQVVEQCRFAVCGDELFVETDKSADSYFVMPLPGVTDPEAESIQEALPHLGCSASAVTTFRRYAVTGIPADQKEVLCKKVLANESIEQIIHDRLTLSEIQLGAPYKFDLRHVEIRNVSDEQLQQISRDWQLSLTLVEMQTIQQHFIELDREPTDAELETIAQTWSEHCSHKTLAGRIEYTDDAGTTKYENMLKETIFHATQTIRADLGADDWCVSVFKDNAGIVKFDDEFNVAFKVETHNRPSALEPYGGANTGIGGVIRDTLGTGLGAKPVCSTDVFCFAPPNATVDQLPPGVMHPRSIMKGVVSGVRDYGNRMGIPTVNGAVYFDRRYVGNPLVFCGNVGLLPCEMSFKEPKPNDLIVSIGGRTGRDGIHGATFSSAELTESSDITSGGAVQIGNAITEKMLMDVMLKARDQRLYNAVTDCGAGGFSSAVGEMGEEIGAEVWLDKAPLKYEGLSYTEIWISEAQERMVFAVPESNWAAFEKLCSAESVEAVVIGQFKPTGRLVLKYEENEVADMAMSFLHDGRPPVVRKAVFNAPQVKPVSGASKLSHEESLLKVLGSWNVASKHWVIRQYDHEVQGGSVIKPLVGIENDGPSDAAVVRPVLNSRRGLVISCGMNPHFGDLDPYHMATSAIDEAIRNCVAVGADPNRIAILDNFCWGYTDRPKTLGALVRAAQACYDVSTVFKTPFISGKDSLHNEFSYTDTSGNRQTISIPSTLLISAMGQIDDVKNCVTMDLKSAGNRIYQVGQTKQELGGSHWCLVNEVSGGQVPQVDAVAAKQIFENMHKAIHAGLVRSCHDISEGGLAASVAEMAFAGGLGVDLDVASLKSDLDGTAILFSESNSRFVCEVPEDKAAEFEAALSDACWCLGSVTENDRVVIKNGNESLVESTLSTLKTAWQQPLDWK